MQLDRLSRLRPIYINVSFLTTQVAKRARKFTFRAYSRERGCEIIIYFSYSCSTSFASGFRILEHFKLRSQRYVRTNPVSLAAEIYIACFVKRLYRHRGALYIYTCENKKFRKSFSFRIKSMCVCVVLSRKFITHARNNISSMKYTRCPVNMTCTL